MVTRLTSAALRIKGCHLLKRVGHRLHPAKGATVKLRAW